MRRMIQSITRALSPNPGQRNRPSEPLRNQFTWKMRGARSKRSFCPTFSQWPK